MHIHGVFRQSGGLRDFSNIEILEESEEKNRTLLFRKSLSRFPNLLNLFVNHRPVFRRNTPIGPVMNFVAINSMSFTPELIATVTLMITNQIDFNPHQPCMDAAVSAKRTPAFISI